MQIQQSIRFQISCLKFTFKWIFIASIIGILIGSASALFLFLLHSAENIRTQDFKIIWLLPIAGLVIGLIYHYFGKDVVKGNNQLLEEFHSPKQIIPFKMAPLVLFGTVITHLFGGSAGREGTAVQMGGAIADQFTKLFNLTNEDRKIIITIGISAGFASVFGTPLAGTIFALEVLIIGRLRFEAIIPSLIAAVVSHYICLLWGTQHTSYQILEVPELNWKVLILVGIVGVFFGWIAALFSQSVKFFTNIFSKIKYPPARPLIGGLLLAIIFYFIGYRYVGLGIPVIQESFNFQLSGIDFIAKLLLTAITLGAGFKGGEVTPLFFIGASLGSFLSFFIPLPISLLAGIGFVAVFSGATNTPIACSIMGIELFGIESGIYITTACVIAYLFSGHTGIYGSQIIGTPKSKISKLLKGQALKD
jgi:H+/Cl- antiporter ClcA